MASSHAPVFRNAGEGRAVAVVGDAYRFLAVGAETDGRYAQFEAIVSPGGGPPPHIHRREEEGFLVLEGEITFQLDDQKFVAGPGTFLNMPIGSLHCFVNRTDRPARMLVTLAPAGLEEMFLQVGSPLAPGEAPKPPTQDEMDRLLAAAPRFGVEIRPPSL